MTGEAVRVPIVDDQRPFRDAAKVVFDLLDQFLVVGEAESGEEALAAVATLRPDLVIMDINLPAMSGVDATQKVLADHPETTIILVSTYEANALPKSASVSGAVAYVHKEHLDADLVEQLWDERTTTMFRTA